jgi:hypothetical protein
MYREIRTVHGTYIQYIINEQCIQLGHIASTVRYRDVRVRT